LNYRPTYLRKVKRRLCSMQTGSLIIFYEDACKLEV